MIDRIAVDTKIHFGKPCVEGSSGIKFLLDQDVYVATVRFLCDLGHDAIPVAQIGLSQASDEELLRIAQEMSPRLQYDLT